MKISIALGTYNGRDFIGEQLRSFVSQSRHPDELVVVDDCSSDDTVELIAEFARTAPFAVRLFVNDANLGFGQNFSKAMSLCTGDLVFLSDQDDVWFERKIETMAGLASRMPGMFCFMNDAVLTDAGLQSHEVTKLQQVRAAGLPETGFVMGCCAAIRREFLEVALPVPPSIVAHDNWLINFCDGLGRTYRYPEPLQLYRRHGANLSNVTVNNTDRVGPLRTRFQKALELASRFNSGHVLNLEHLFYSALAERLCARSKDLAALVGQRELDAYTAEVVERHAILSARAAIRDLARRRRPRAIAALSASGGYRAASGWLSALKDLLVARH